MAKKKSLLEKAMESRGKKDRVVSTEKGKITTIHIRNDLDGRKQTVIYETLSSCMSCSKERLCCGETASCPVCDNLMTNKEYTEFEKKFKIESPQPRITKPESQEYPMEIVNQSTEITIKQKEKMLLDNIQLYTFMVNNVLDRKKDYFKYPNGSEHIKRSGCLKLALAFNLSVEPISIEIEREYDKEGKEIDIHAHATAKIVRQNGTYVIATGTKSKSEYYSKRKNTYGSYNLHNLRTTAMTKATNHGIVDAIGFAQVTYEEMEKPTDKKEVSGDLENAFGGK